SLPRSAQGVQIIDLIRLPDNRGIAAARNIALARSDAPLIACINVEILPRPDWLEVCTHYLLKLIRVGACFTRIVPGNTHSLLSRWRMRFHEQKYGEFSGPASFAPGHAVLLRREAIESVGGYDEHLRRITEDSDICERMWKAGWEIHYVAES